MRVNRLTISGGSKTLEFRKKSATHLKLSDRHNILVFADEAHRGQYGFIDGFIRHMQDALPSASFVGFTGTPTQASGRPHKGRVWRQQQHSTTSNYENTVPPTSLNPP